MQTDRLDMLEKQELTTVTGAAAEAAPEGYITTLDKDGNIKEVRDTTQIWLGQTEFQKIFSLHGCQELVGCDY